MATALMVTFMAVQTNRETGYVDIIGVSSQTLTFVDIGPAEKALAAMKQTYAHASDIHVEGTILKDVVI